MQLTGKTSVLKSRNFGDKVVPWLFITPAIVFTIWLKYYPIMKSFYMSFFEYSIMKPPGRFIFLDNYINLLSEHYFRQAWVNTFWFFILNFTFVFFIPIIQALFLSEIVRGYKTFTTIYIIPAVIPLSVNVIIWKWIWHPTYGLANVILKALGWEPKTWLGDPAWTKFCITFPGIIGGGVAVLLYLAAIKSIPGELNEAAQLDGCTIWKRMRYVTLPNIRFLIGIQAMFLVISIMQILDAPYQYASGGPNGVSTSVGVFIYKTVNEDVSYGRSSAASVILFIVIGIMTFIQQKMDKSEAA